MDSSTQSSYIKAVFTAVGVLTRKVLHAFRPSGAMAAAQHGCLLEQIAQAGRWRWGKNDVLAFCYIGLICKEVALILAGHSKTPGHHVIHRAHIPKSEGAGMHIFPWLEEEEARVLKVSYKLYEAPLP